MKYLLVIVVAVFLIAGLLFFNRTQTQNIVTQHTTSLSPSVNQETNIIASFTIITDNITRSFKALKYHNKSQDVYIESSDPSVVHVKKSGITWDDFFNTLPMKLTKDCLITGDGEELCHNKNGTLEFFLNDIKDPNLLDKEIKEGNKALIKFTSL